MNSSTLERETPTVLAAANCSEHLKLRDTHYRYMSALVLSYDEEVPPQQAYDAMLDVFADYAQAGELHHAGACLAGLARINQRLPETIAA